MLTCQRLGIAHKQGQIGLVFLVDTLESRAKRKYLGDLPEDLMELEELQQTNRRLTLATL